VLAFLTGWLLRAQDDRRGPGLPSTIGWLLACGIVGSIGGLAWQLSPYRGELARTFDGVIHDYYRTDLMSDRLGLVDGARLLEGLAVTAATVALFRQRPRLAEQLPAALALSATAAGAASLVLWLGLVPAATLGQYARTGYRVSALVADVNAAGSYFAMVLCLALAMTFRSKGWHRWPGAGRQRDGTGPGCRGPEPPLRRRAHRGGRRHVVRDAPAQASRARARCRSRPRRSPHGHDVPGLPGQLRRGLSPAVLRHQREDD
jgi:hypothetical protein